MFSQNCKEISKGIFKKFCKNSVGSFEKILNIQKTFWNS